MGTLNDIKAIVFDQGNTIIEVNFDSVIQNVNFSIPIEKYHLTATNDKLISRWIKSDHETTFPYISHLFQEKEIVLEMLFSLNVHDSIKEPLCTDLLSLYRKKLEYELRSSKNLKQLTSLFSHFKNKGKILAVFSNDRSKSLENSLKLSNIIRFFDYAYSSEEMGCEKPSPLFFECMCQKIGVPKQTIVYVGDSYENDIVAAKKAGLKAIHFAKLNHSKSSYLQNAVPDAVIDDLDELKKIIS